MIEIAIPVREVTLVGDLRVKRILPYRARRMVGPFAFLDEMGPVLVGPGHAGDIPPHPHIGLSTVTFLFEGELVHRDSLGTRQEIFPGDVNWMTSGRGIAHSERIPEQMRSAGKSLHGMQAWVALPREDEETEPAFEHHSKEVLPRLEIEGVQIVLIAGAAFGRASPVRTHSKLFYFEARMPAGSSLCFDPDGQEAAFYLVRGRIQIGGQDFDGPVMLVFKTGAALRIDAMSGVHGLFLGGHPLEGPRHIWWNFVSSSRERIEKAKEDWREQRFPAVPEESEYVPLPGYAEPSERSTLP